MTRMFTMDAEFGNFVNEADLFVGEVLHKAVIDINEIGTVAVAATRKL